MRFPDEGISPALRAPSPKGRVYLVIGGNVMLPEGFVYVKDVIPSVREDIRYAGYHNFVGCPVDGYFAPRAVLQEKAALALKEAAAAFENLGYGLLIYDAYRP